MAHKNSFPGAIAPTLHSLRSSLTRAGSLAGSLALLCSFATSASGLQLPCETDVVDLSTGKDPASSGLLPVGASDGQWKIVCDPDMGASAPRPADVVAAQSSWPAAIPGSQWISPSAQPGASASPDEYCFQRCFCLEEGFQDPVLLIQYQAMLEANLFLNGTYVSSYIFGSGVPDTVVIDNPQIFQVGLNCIEVRVRNPQGGGAGLDMLATITTAGDGLLDPSCCDPLGDLQGSKWNDLNANGVWDAGEPPLAGWTIILSDGSTTVTDSTGHYYFQDLLPGPYTVTEEDRTGWTQHYPSSGSHSVTVSEGVVLNQLDFGNSEVVAIFCTGNGNGGSNVACPCGNMGALLGGCVNSTGGGGRIDGSGTASASADDLVLSLSNLPPHQFGLIFMGSAQIEVVFGDGKRCVGGATNRFQIQNSGAAGTMTLGPGIVTSSQNFPANAQISAGQTWNFQGWYRDPGGPCGQAFNLTDAASVTFLP